ncbi:MAG: flagellar basal-body MS-ring/collar protein FliF [Solirubrobacteraceae bacterium]
MPVRQMATKLSPRGWAVIAASAAAAMLFLYFVFQMASQPSYSTLLTGLDPAQTGKITSTLDTKGITYQLQNGGTALAVQADKTSQARVALATAGLLGSQQPGFSLFDKQQLGSSNFQQQITYQRALEGQLAGTIQSIQGVSAAQVQLVLPNPQDQLFSDNTQPATAAVLLSGSTALDPAAVKGIAQLVSSSVPGLHSDKVTITDASGQLLWPTGDGSAAGNALLSKQAAEARYDSAAAAQVNAMLARTLGPGKAQVEVNADVDANQASSDTLTYHGPGVPIVQQNNTESLTGGGAAAGGAAGTAANIPGVAATGAGGTSKYNHKQTDTTFGVNKTVTHAVIAPGKVNRQSVSVLVDKSVPATAIPALKAAVTSAVGLQPKRGDLLSFGQVAFATPVAPKPAAKPSSIMGYAKYGAVAFAALLFLGFIGRLLRRREHESFAGGQPTWVRELESPRPLAALESADEQPTRVAQLSAPVNVAKRQIEDLVERDPDRVAQQVRAWMAED